MKSLQEEQVYSWSSWNKEQYEQNYIGRCVVDVCGKLKIICKVQGWE